ncbi:MAG: hypothetical protein ACFE85_10965 [Candidatus Hodarchaeota archaeon]
MSSGSIEKEKEDHIIIDITSERSLDHIISEMVIPFSSIMESKSCPDIYEGYEKIPFQQRHPIYKAMMKLEFEEAIREFWSNKKNK